MCLCAGIEVRMKRFTQVGILCIWVTAAFFTLCFFSSDSLARDPQPGVVSPIDQMVGGEPGEDPHLRVSPNTKIEPIWLPTGSGMVGLSGDGTNGRRVFGALEYSAIPNGDVRASLLWRLFLDALSCVLSR